MRTRGFTVIELVVVIVVTGVLAAAAIIFFKPAIDSYFNVQRRASLTDMADTALRRMARDVRFAVPNSVRTPDQKCFELIPAIGGGRYRSAVDTVNDTASYPCAAPDVCSAPLDISQPAAVFDVLAMSPSTASPQPNDWVVIDNQNTNDVYAGSNSARISAVATPAASAGVFRITVAPAKQFPSAYDGNRFMIVPDAQQAVFYWCDGVDANGSGTLYRSSHYGFNPAYPAACPTVGGEVLARHVSSCNFVYDPSQGTQQFGFVWMQLGLTDANETVTLSFGAHVDNVP